MGILWPYKMIAEYADGFSGRFGGWNEGDCMYSICLAEDEHGPCTYYSALCDENYIDGVNRWL